jgi:hypothetical protein
MKHYTQTELELLSNELKIDVSEIERVVKANLSIFDLLKERAIIKGCTIEELLKSDIESLRKLDQEQEFYKKYFYEELYSDGSV